MSSPWGRVVDKQMCNQFIFLGKHQQNRVWTELEASLVLQLRHKGHVGISQRQGHEL